MQRKYNIQLKLWLTLSFLISLGWVFGLILTTFITEIFTANPENITTLILAGILGGLVISFLSMLIAGNFIKSAMLWTLFTTLGWLLGLSSTLLITQTMKNTAGWLIGGAIGGLVFVIAQSFGFNAEFNSRSFLWLTLNALAWAGAYGLGYALPTNLSLEQLASINMVLSKGMLGWVLLGTLAGLFYILFFAVFKRGDRGDKVQWLP